MTVRERQNQPDMIGLLYARNKLMGRVKIYQGILLTGTLILSAASFFAGGFPSAVRASIALTALVLGVFDAAWLDPWQKKQLKLSAKLQEQFDCHVMGIPWNSFVAGSKIDPEVVHGMTRGATSTDDLEDLKNWHSGTVGELDTVLAALVCQRSNLWYDCTQRRRYLCGLYSVLFLAMLVFTYVQIETGATLADAVLATTPIVGFLNWGAREGVRQRATIEASERLKADIERLWSDRITVNDASTDVARVRELQDAIFQLRSGSPLIFDWVYKLLRPRLDQDMKAGTDAWVEQLKVTAKEGIL